MSRIAKFIDTKYSDQGLGEGNGELLLNGYSLFGVMKKLRK